MAIPIHIVEHLRLRLPVRWISLHRARVHGRLLRPVILLLHPVLAQRVLGRSHVVLLLHASGLMHLACCPGARVARGAGRRPLAMRRRLFAGHDVDEEVEHVRLREGGGDV